MFLVRWLISCCARRRPAASPSISGGESFGAISNFLPANFNPATATITLLAGRGLYPLLAARRILATGMRLCLIASEDADEALMELFPKNRRARYNAGQIGKLLNRLEEYGSTHALMAGQVAPKRLFHGLRFDVTAIRLLASLRRRNAETIFGALAAAVERRGVELLDARCFMDQDLAIAGFMGQHRPRIDQLDHGIAIARAVAALDIGQGIVQRRGTVLAVEGFDGTDRMLRRCAEFATDRKWFIKTSKPGQDFRFDVPVVGWRTLDAMDRGGIGAMAVEAGSTILLDKERLIAEANGRKIGIFGYGGDP
ncbi:MAG: UDP-2,3-diacylglucosamine diphosphatase LpxI [Puniceicoccales bacterium]|jgi:DUF1009 family protein|nr:UDP-2,3-diacylglucosamine diphosphatase LpxI [Puniceicoccales bacterium]